MRYRLILMSISLSLLLLTGKVSAQSQNLLYSPVTPTPNLEYSLPYPGILPDHPLYILKTARDRILLFFTNNPEKKVHLNLLLADKRLVMGQLLWEKGKRDLSITTFSKAEKYLLAAGRDLSYLKKKENLPAGLADKIELAARKHEEIIEKLMLNISDETRRQELSDTLGINHQAIQQVLSVK